MSETLEKLLETAKKISNNSDFLLDVKIYSDKEKYHRNPFDSTEECRQYLIENIEKGTIQTRNHFYKIFGLEIINCQSGEILAVIE